MQTHELKTDPEVFQASWDHRKPYEIRYNDRQFMPGDKLILREIVYTGAEMRAGRPLKYTGRVILATVTNSLIGPVYGLLPNWCILSVKLDARILDGVVIAEEHSCGGIACCSGA